MQRFLALLIAGQLTLFLVLAAQAADPFTSAGVANPDAPVNSGISTGVTTPGTAGSNDGTTGGTTSGAAGATNGAGNNVTGNTASGGSSSAPPRACLGTDLLLQHGFTQSELGQLEQTGKLFYPDRIEYQDSDGDGLFDNEELLLKTDPNKADTDGDGFPDAQELAFGFDPLKKDVRPFAESLRDPILWANQMIQTLRYALNKLPHLEK